MTTAVLNTIRYFTETTPYHYTYDNQPLQDLENNDIALNAAIASISVPTSVPGNAGTATALQTPRAINGVNFDGTAAITVPADATTLTGTALPAAVVGSSLTSVGTLGALTVTAPIAGSVTGNAATATALQTSRSINGVSFNGTSAITVPAAAGTLTGTALAAGVVSSSLTSVGTLSSLGVTGATTSGSFVGPVTGNITGAVTSYSVDTGAVNAAVVTYTPAISAVNDGLVLWFKAVATNTGATTLNVNGLGASPVVGAAHSALQGGEILANGRCMVIWSATLSSWVLIECTGGALQIASATQTSHAVNYGQSFGLGQTWQDMHASRALATTYTNSTGRAITVTVEVANTVASSTVSVNIAVNSIVVTSQTNIASATIGWTGITASAVVPAGATYQVTTTQASVASWFELR